MQTNDWLVFSERHGTSQRDPNRRLQPSPTGRRAHAAARRPRRRRDQDRAPRRRRRHPACRSNHARNVSGAPVPRPGQAIGGARSKDRGRRGRRCQDCEHRGRRRGVFPARRCGSARSVLRSAQQSTTRSSSTSRSTATATPVRDLSPPATTSTTARTRESSISVAGNGTVHDPRESRSRTSPAAPSAPSACSPPSFRHRRPERGLEYPSPLRTPRCGRWASTSRPSWRAARRVRAAAT